MAALKTTGATEIMDNLRVRWLPDPHLALTPLLIQRGVITREAQQAPAKPEIDLERIALTLAGMQQPEIPVQPSEQPQTVANDPEEESPSDSLKKRVGIGMSYDCPSCRRRTEIYFQNPLDGRKPPLLNGHKTSEFSKFPKRTGDLFGGMSLDKAVNCAQCRYRHEIIAGIVSPARPGR